MQMNTTTLKGIIFDLDGTLADTLPVCIESYTRVFRKHLRREFTPEEILDMFGLPEEGILAKWVPQDPKAALNDYLTEYAALHSAIKEPFPGILAVLQQLQACGLRLGMVTGKGPESAAISLERLGLQPYVDPVVTGDFTRPSKPKGIHEVLAAWGMAPHNAAYLGDTPYDMQSALEAGVKPLGAAWAKTATVHNGHKDSKVKVFESVTDFQTWVETQIENRGQ